jgi:DNA repair exonuclease SbcCD ATPase subunit
MRYVALILKGFKRFALNQVSHFEIHPKEQVQLILGTNGSGKSSLLQEMTPLPANPADYLKTGSKEVHIVDRGFSYVLKSDFAVKQIHSFVREGEELNPGGTASVQKELVRQHFGITTELHELATGGWRLTDMGPSKRREWFTQLSDVSFDYAIAVFEKLRKEHRSVVGALDLDKKRLVNEQTKIITDEEQRQLHADVKQLHLELDQLRDMRKPLERTQSEIEQDIRRTDAQLLQLSNMLLNIKVESPAHISRNDWGELEKLEFTNTDQVDDHIEELAHHISAQSGVLNRLFQDHEKLKETVEILKKRGDDGVESIQKKITLAVERRNAILSQRKLDAEGWTPGGSLQTLQSIEHDLVAILSELPNNENKLFSSTTLHELKEQRAKQRDFMQRKTHELAQAQARKQHADEHRENGSVTCPKCSHRFHMGLTEAQYEGLKNYIKLIGEEMALTEESLKKLETGIAEQENYGNLFRQFIQLTRSTPMLNPFWDIVASQELAKNAPRKIVTMLEVLRFDLECINQAAKVEEEITELRKLLEQASKVGDQNITEATQRLNALTVEVELMTKSLTQTRKDLVEWQAYRRQLAEALRLQQEIMKVGNQYEALTFEAVEAIRRTTILQCIQQTQSSLARKEETLNTLKQQQAVVENLKVTIAQRVKEEVALKAAVKALSPTDGLIAEGLLGFVRQFTKEMNALIRKIWAYTLEVQPCGISTEQGAELDYKFPMVVGSRDNIVPDVSRGSSGMQEIVDLAWKVIALKYSHLETGALLLDEFGKTLDLEHRTAAIMAIKSLLETKPFSQLFMISHYESHYGAFSNAEVCVLDARNIAVPRVYNQHVIIQ